MRRVGMAQHVLHLLAPHVVPEQVGGGGGPQRMAGEGARGHPGGLHAALEGAQQVVAGQGPVGQLALAFAGAAGGGSLVGLALEPGGVDVGGHLELEVVVGRRGVELAAFLPEVEPPLGPYGSRNDNLLFVFLGWDF